MTRPSRTPTRNSLSAWPPPVSKTAVERWVSRARRPYSRGALGIAEEMRFLGDELPEHERWRGMAKRKILLVDDSTTVIALERLILRDEEAEIVTATNGRLALELAVQQAPDLILLDIVMPEMDGVECCRRLKSNPLTSAVPVIMVTTKGNQKMVDSAFEAGCDDFVTKPIDKVDLIQKIKRLLRSQTESAPGAKL
jgi:PleD family two-component response regulator